MPKKPLQIPKNWPESVPYLTENVYPRTLSPSILTCLSQPISPATDNSTILHTYPLGPHTNVRITPISTATHPANGQYGLFATRLLEPGTFVLPYLGEIHCSLPTEDTSKFTCSTMPALIEDEHNSSDYDLSLDRLLGIGIDAAKAGNEARFINDYRGVKDRCNAEFKEVWDARTQKRGMGVFVLERGNGGKSGKPKFRGIGKGEEILVR